MYGESNERQLCWEIATITTNYDTKPFLPPVTFPPNYLPVISHLSHNKPCFPCNIAITNFLVSNKCEIRFHDLMGQSTVPMYSNAKFQNKADLVGEMNCFGTLSFNFSYVIKRI